MTDGLMGVGGLKDRIGTSLQKRTDRWGGGGGREGMGKEQD